MSQYEPITRWVEPCAGMLSVGLRLRARDYTAPIAWLGGKRAYAAAILDGIGARPGAGCRDLVIADAGPAGEFWRALTEGGVVDQIDTWCRDWPRDATSERRLYDHLLPAAKAGDAAAWIVVAGWSFRAGDITSGWARGVESSRGERSPMCRLDRMRLLIDRTRSVCAGMAVYQDAREIPICVDGRTVVYIDPPYANTTGYAVDFSRADVIDLATRWSDAGAEVLISERDPVVPGWRAARIWPAGHGSRSGAWEWLTLSPFARWRHRLTDDHSIRAPGGSKMMSNGTASEYVQQAALW